MRLPRPRSLSGQIITLLLLAMAASQIVIVVLFAGERRGALVAEHREQVLERVASVVRLLDATPGELHDRVLAAVDNRHLRLGVTPERPVIADALPGETEQTLHDRLTAILGDRPASDIHVALAEPQARRFSDRRNHRHHWSPPRVVISVHLANGSWLTARITPTPPKGLALPTVLSLGLTALAMVVVVMLTVRRLNRPLADLASATEKLGRGEDVPLLVERGPVDIRRVTRAFNRMQARLKRFVEDRTRLLAAISHDLRTPITTLRLRAEFVEDPEIRARILDTLDEMEQMTEATLAFAREEAASEDTRDVDLTALVDSVCTDFADAGADVEFTGDEKHVCACRPVALKRALRNLVENAVRYGGGARIHLVSEAGAYRIVVEDDGPGLPPEAIERVFEPFVRLEESRSRKTGGVGLGLAHCPLDRARPWRRHHAGKPR